LPTTYGTAQTQNHVGVSEASMNDRGGRSFNRTPSPLSRRLVNTAYVGALQLRERRIPWWSNERIERLQRRRIVAMVHHAFERVPFYRETMQELGLSPQDVRTRDDLARLPLIGPDEVRSDVERFTSEGLRRDGWVRSYTSGTSTTVRGSVLRDNRAVLYTLAKVERDRTVLTRLAGERYPASLMRELLARGSRFAPLARVADRGGTHQRLSIFPGEHSVRTERTLWSHRSLLPARSAHHHYLPASAPLQEAAALFDELRPRIVFSFGSYAEQFLRFAFAGSARPWLPPVWAYIGDMVSPEGWRIATELGVQLHSSYSAVEAGRIGFQCEHRGGHHLNVDTCAVRVVDPEGRDVPPGEAGDIVISNLINRATVLLNYRLGDRVALDPTPCPCGRSLPLLSSLQGRSSDLVRLADGRELSVFVLDGMFRTQLRGALKAQVAQAGSGALRWTLVPLPGTEGAALRDAMIDRARQKLPGTQLEVVLAEEIASTPAGKFRHRVTPGTDGAVAGGDK
jgi:hypothetical protein